MSEKGELGNDRDGGERIPQAAAASAMPDELIPDLIAAVEQQLVSPQTKYVAKAFGRLVEAGLEAGEAKRQIAMCLGEELDEVMRKKRGFDENAYRAALDELPLEEDGAEG